MKALMLLNGQDVWYRFTDWLSRNSKAIWDSFFAWLKTAGVNLATSLVILIIGLWISNILAKVIAKMLHNPKLDNKAAAYFIASCLKVVFKLIVIVAAVARLGINIASITAALGAAGITVGLAMKDSLSNLASGVLILFNKPFGLGDFIEVNGNVGTVKDIELTYTKLSTPDNKDIIVPNSKMIDDLITNYTAQKDRRLEMRFPLPYGADIQQVKQLITEACRQSRYVYQDKEIIVGIRELSNSAVDYELRCWIDCQKYWDAYFEVNELVMLKLAEAGIEVPFEQVDVHMK